MRLSHKNLDAEIATEIRRLGLDTRSVQKQAQEGKIEAWVHKFLLSGKGGSSNAGFSDSLKREKRWWNGPINLNLAELSPAVGADPSLEYVVAKEDWHAWTSNLADTFTHPLALPPLIIEYRSGKLSIREGNTRYGAMQLLDWQQCWVVIWYNSEADFQQHSSVLEQST